MQYFYSWANWVDMAIISIDVVVETALILAANLDGFPSLVTDFSLCDGRFYTDIMVCFTK